MIIKYQGHVGLREKGMESFSYIEGCENVTTERVSLNELLNEFISEFDKRYCETEKIVANDYQNNARSIEAVLRSREENRQGKHAIDFTDTMFFIASMLGSCAENLSNAIMPEQRENERVFTFLAEALLGDEKINKEWFYDTKLKIITYTKEEKNYKLFTIGIVYLLNDSGKTVDIVK